MTDWIEITPHKIDAAKAIDFVTSPQAGGIATFLGTTRAEKDNQCDLIALDYEAYEEMAQKQLNMLALRAHEKFPIVKIALVHRIGRVPLAEASVVIAVSTPHRAEAFDACRFLIDELKKDVAIWKKEIWSDQTSIWVDPMH